MCSYGKYRNRLFTPVTEPLSITSTKIRINSIKPKLTNRIYSIINIY